MSAACAGSPPGGGGGRGATTDDVTSGLTGSCGGKLPSWTEAVDMMFWRLWTNQGFFCAKEFN